MNIIRLGLSGSAMLGDVVTFLHRNARGFILAAPAFVIVAGAVFEGLHRAH